MYHNLLCVFRNLMSAETVVILFFFLFVPITHVEMNIY